MRKILIVGSGGAGKSTLARRLSATSGIEVIHLDQLYWQPNWVKSTKAEWFATLAGLLEKDSWIMDGNYDGSLEPRLAKCDTVIFLDLPRTLCLYRVVKRVIRYRNRTRPDMAKGCNEKIDREFIKWIWDYPKKDKLQVEEKIRLFAAGKTIIRLRSQREIEAFLTKFEAQEIV